MRPARPRARLDPDLTGTSRTPSTTTVGDVMSAGLLACPPSTPLRTVAGMMVVHEVHAVALWDAPAVVTDLDLVAAAGAIDTADAAAAASTPATVAPGDPLIAAAAAMAESGRSHALVAEPGAARPIGMLSTLDIAAALAGRDARAARTLRPRPARPAISTSRLDRVEVASAMHVGVFTCPPEASLRDVATILVEQRVHCVAVAGTPAPASWKFVTDLGIARAATGDLERQAADLVDEATWIAADATLDEAVELMLGKHTSHLLVRGHHAPVGVLSTLDVIDVLAVDAG
jgi:CBS domain-containing protein